MIKLEDYEVAVGRQVGDVRFAYQFNAAGGFSLYEVSLDPRETDGSIMHGSLISTAVRRSPTKRFQYVVLCSLEDHQEGYFMREDLLGRIKNEVVGVYEGKDDDEGIKKAKSAAKEFVEEMGSEAHRVAKQRLEKAVGDVRKVAAEVALPGLHHAYPSSS